MGSRRRTYTDLVDVVSYTYIFQYKNSSGSWVNIGSSTSVNLGTVSASGGSSSISIRHYREKYVNGMFTSNEASDLSYSLPSGVTKTQSGSVSNDYVSIFSYSYGNNTSTSSRTLSMSITCNGNTITASMSQSAGSKSYGSWSSWSVSVSNSGSVSASGGSSTISRSASRYRIWTWNGVAGSGSTEYEYGTPQLSVTSGSGTLSGTTLSYGNNTSTSSRSTRVTGTYSGASDYTDVVQSAGSKQYGSWGAWNISLSASSTTIAAAGGSATITRSATRTRTWTWNGVSGSGGTETGTGTPTLSKVSGNATLSGTTVTYSNNTSTSSRSSVIRATMDSITKDITISQSAGSKSYGSWSSWSVSVSNSGSVSASGGSSTISRSASRYRIWTWNGVAGSGSTEYEYGTPQLSVTSGSGTLSGTTLSYGNNTSTSSRSTRVTGTYSGASDYTDVVQSAGSKQYGSWGAWNISLSASSTTIAAAGGSATITRSATRTRTWTWNGVSGSGGTETGTGTPTLSKVSGNATLSGTTVTYSNNTSTSSRSSVIRATMDSITKDITISQSAGSKVNSYSDWGVVYRYRTAESWNVFPSVGDILNLTIDCTDISHAFNQIVYVTIRRTNTWTWNGVAGSGGTEYEYDSDTSMSVYSYSGTSASCYYDSSAGSYKVVSGVSAPTGSDSSESTIIKLSSPVGGKSYFTITNIRQSTSPTAIGRLVIKNTRFTTSNLALPVQVGSESDTIYSGEAAYLKIYDNSNGVYIYLPTGATLSKGGALDIWFEDINVGSRYSCTMSNTSTPNNYVRFSNANSIINVLVLNNASDYTIVGQCSMKSNSVTFNIRILIEP